MSESRTRFYLDKRNGKIMGVCAGIADYFGWDVTLVRAALAVGVVMGGGALIPAYFVVGWIANEKPRSLYEEAPERLEFWRDVRVAPKRTLRDVNAQFRDADRRLRDLEYHLTSDSRQLADEIEKLR